LVEKSRNYSVNIPLNGQMEKEVLYCGSHSKRDVDKISDCQFELADGMRINSPIITGCDQYYECQILTQHKLPIERVEGDDSHEEDDDGHYHVLYYGEIVASYEGR
jgi:flavin reductase (DIM6/NTAB) family NADH-FMN oxidoreductase RutF